jgi:DNA-binding transcriptional LysR family regulator
MSLPCNNLNLNLYRVFYTVAKTKSFSESSRVLHISQPAISKHIQNLEYELNTLLFYRNNRGIELTQEAKQLLNFVEKAYNFLMLGEKSLQESKELMQGKVSVGIPTAISVYYFKDKIEEFMTSHPNIVIKLSSHNNEALINLMLQHTLDVLILAGDTEINKDLKVIPLMEDDFVFAYNFEKLNIVVDDLKDLTNYPMLLPVKTTDARKNVEKVFSNVGITTNPIMELETPEMMLNYTKDGIGIGYVLRHIAEQTPSLKIIDIKEELPKEKIRLVYDDISLTTSTKKFINLITNNKLD